MEHRLGLSPWLLGGDRSEEAEGMSRCLETWGLDQECRVETDRRGRNVCMCCVCTCACVYAHIHVIVHMQRKGHFHP